MPRLSADRLPKYRLHKQSGQAIVTLNSHDFLLGKHDSPESHDKYDRLIAEWLAGARTCPMTARTKDDGLLVSELIARFWVHAETHYRRADGTVTGELENFRHTVRPLNRLYGSTFANDFGPLALKAVRGEMVKLGWCRNVVNRQTSRIRQIFRWASENELVLPAVWAGLRAVSGLRRGRSGARETEPIRPVPDSVIEATIPWLPPHVKIMVELQRLTGMRPGELCTLRAREIDRSRPVWQYKPPQHKTTHHGHVRIIYLGPRSQGAIETILLSLADDAFVFSPARSEAERHGRESPARASARNRKRPPSDQYDVHAYRRAITRACNRADRWAKGGVVIGNEERLVPEWHPHQIRHTASTEWRRIYGPDAALTMLGDRTTRMLDIYAEKDQATAEHIASATG